MKELKIKTIKSMFLSHKDSRSMINNYTLICKNHQTIKKNTKINDQRQYSMQEHQPRRAIKPRKKKT